MSEGKGEGREIEGGEAWGVGLTRPIVCDIVGGGFVYLLIVRRIDWARRKDGDEQVPTIEKPNSKFAVMYLDTL